ncbi:MAG: hypothetical protein ACOYYU_10315 [Chloroflexota bacterium]
MDENKDSDLGEELVNTWPRMTWLDRKRILLLVFYYVQRHRFETWLHGVMRS